MKRNVLFHYFRFFCLLVAMFSGNAFFTKDTLAQEEPQTDEGQGVDDDDLVVIIRPTPGVEEAGVYEDQPVDSVAGQRYWFSGSFVPAREFSGVREQMGRVLDLSWLAPMPGLEERLLETVDTAYFFDGRYGHLNFVELAAVFGVNPYDEPGFNASQGIYTFVDPIDQTGASRASGLPDIDFSGGKPLAGISD